MSRVEAKERPAKREAQEGRRQSGDRVDRAPTKVKSERTVDQDRRS